MSTSLADRHHLARLIERGIPGATVRRRFDSTGFRCEIEVKLWPDG